MVSSLGGTLTRLKNINIGFFSLCYDIKVSKEVLKTSINPLHFPRFASKRFTYLSCTLKFAFPRNKIKNCAPKLTERICIYKNDWEV